MVRILYDFDITKILNSNYYCISKRRIVEINKDFEQKIIRKSRLLIDLQFLGGGYDSIFFVNNLNQTFYVVEPSNGLIVAYELIEGLLGFETKRIKNNSKFQYTIGSGIDESIFRHHRNDDEFMVSCNITNFSVRRRL